MKYLIFITILISASAYADKILFREEGELYNAKIILHLSLNLTFNQILDHCTDFRRALIKIHPIISNNSFGEDLWYHAAYLIRSECNFDHIWPGESSRAREEANARGKRQVLLVPIIFNTVMGFMNRRSINRVASKLEKAEHHIREGIVLLAAHETRLNILDRDIQHINSTLFDIIRSLSESIVQTRLVSWFTIFHMHFQTLIPHLRALRDGWLALHQHRLPMEWVNAKSLRSIHETLISRATLAGGILPFANQAEIFDFPTSFHWNDKCVLVFTHIPIVDARMQTFEFLPVPIQTPAGFMHVHSALHRDILVVSSGNKLHRETSSDELARRCFRHGIHHVCQGLGAFHRRMDATCLGALFANQIGNVTRLCTLSPVQEDWLVVQATGDRFHIYSRNQINIVVDCHNGTRSAHPVSGLSTLQISAGCDAFSSSFDLMPFSDSEMSTTVDHEVAWDVTLPAFFSKKGEGHLEEALHHLRQLRVSATPEQAKASMDHLKRLLEDSSPAEHVGWAFGSVSVLLVVILVTVLACLAVRFRKHYTQWLSDKKQAKVEVAE